MFSIAKSIFLGDPIQRIVATDWALRRMEVDVAEKMIKFINSYVVVRDSIKITSVV